MAKGLKERTSGVLVVDKPKGLTSFDVVRKIRKITGIRKVGHTGTLDPMATGVLLVCLNQATKLTPFLQEGTKIYTGRILLGISTDTDDITGRVTAKTIVREIEPNDILKIAAEFVGVIEQVPPAYSAVKINGRPAYEMARKGQKVALKSRHVEVFHLEVAPTELPLIPFEAKVSKGTYIRTLAADIGRRLRTGACLESLRREESTPFSVGEAVSLSEIELLAKHGRLADCVIPLDRALSFLPKIEVTGSLADRVQNGQPLYFSKLNHSPPPTRGPVRIQANGHGLLAVYEYNPETLGNGEPTLTPLRVLQGN